MSRKMPSVRELLSQVFLKDKDLVSTLVERSSISYQDTVLEIGPGEGIITDELLSHAGYVIAVEKDRNLYNDLVRRYSGVGNLELHNDDILRFNLPYKPYKVFSNIPFSIEGKVIRRLMDETDNPPQDSYLVTRKEFGERISGDPREGQFSVLHKPWFNISIFHRFKRGDFKPKPKVQSVMLRFMQRPFPLVEKEDIDLYTQFIVQGFGGGRRIKQNLSKIFTPKQLNRLASEHGFKINNKPSDLTFEQWLAMFEFFKTEASQSQRRKFFRR